MIGPGAKDTATAPSSWISNAAVPLIVLEDRASETVAAWLQAHPEVKVVARDRAEAYATGIREGAPDATQVADRFHLFQNLAAALQEVFSAHPHEIAALNEAKQSEPLTLDDGSVAVPVAPPVSTVQAQQTIGAQPGQTSSRI